MTLYEAMQAFQSASMLGERGFPVERDTLPEDAFLPPTPMADPQVSQHMGFLLSLLYDPLMRARYKARHDPRPAAKYEAT